jgi:hypothetical protein
MPSPHPIKVRFTKEEIISAQRMRFLRSTRLKVISGLFIFAMAFMLLQLVFPDTMRGINFATWPMTIGLLVAFASVIGLFYFVSPLIDYANNEIWQTPFSIKITPELLFITIEGSAKGTNVKWERVRRVDENDAAYILYLGSESMFLIIPKSIFTDANTHMQFRQNLAKKSSLSPREKQRLSEHTS